jgi:hypothetical protein
MVDLDQHNGAEAYNMVGMSDDGRTIYGYSVLPGDAVGNEPLMWRCR